MKKIFTISCLLVLLNYYSAFAQSDYLKIDSLKKVLLTEEEDTNRVNTLNALSKAMWRSNDSINARHYGNEALSLAEKTNFEQGKANAYLNIGNSHLLNGNYAEALKNCQTALNFFKKSGDKQGMASAYGGLGYAYFDQDNYPESLKNWYAALNHYEEAGDKQGIAKALQEIGHSYIFQGNDSDALNSFVTSLKIRDQIADKQGIGQTYNSIGEIYSHRGKYTEALQKHFAALKIFQGPNMPDWGISYSYDEIGSAYEGQGDSATIEGNKIIAAEKFNEAAKNYYAALELWKKNRYPIPVASDYCKLGGVYIKLKKFLVAKKYIEEGFRLSIALNNKGNLKEGYYSLSVLDSHAGNYKQAYDHYKLYVLYRDSLTNEETAKKSLMAKMQYESDKKDAITKVEQEKKEAEQQRVKVIQYFTIISLVILVLVILLIAFIQWRSNQQKKKANLLLQQQKEKVESTLTELKSTQAQLIHSEKMASLGELTAGIAHEIQNPLNFVNNFSEVNRELIQELKSEKSKVNTERDEQLEIDILNDIEVNEEKITHHGKRADAIVKGMLQHSRASTGKKEPTDINALADEYLRLSYHGMRAKDKSFNVDFKTDFDESIGKLNIIPQDIGRVMLNLFNNAFYAVNEKKKTASEIYKPCISVKTKKLTDKIEIKVADNGNGIPQTFVDKIFQPFFTTKPTGLGTGLGLSLAYDIIKAHGGEIKVETKEGEGSQFIIQLS